MENRMMHRTWLSTLLAALWLAFAAPLFSEVDVSEADWKRADLDGIAVDFRMVRAPKATGALQENELVRFEFSISDTATGTPLSGAYPAAWMDRIPPGEAVDTKHCEDKIETFLGGSLFTRAELDLNVYYVLTMNDDATLSVVDPLFGFGGTKLLAMAQLWAPGRDWVLTRDGRRVLVSMPDVDAVAVVETHDWQVVTNIRTAPSPGRMVLQNDGAYLWVAFEQPMSGDSGSGVAVLQPDNMAERTRLVTGTGPHDLAVSHDDRLVFVTNAGDGTVSVVDVRTLKVLETFETGPRPTSIAWSEAAHTAYVADAEDGSMTVIDGHRLEITARLETRPGLAQIRSAPGGRLLLAVNPDANVLHVVDASKNAVVQTGPMAGGPDQVAFSDTLAYVRHRDSEQVLMVPLAELGNAGAPIPAVDFPGGRAAPGGAGVSSLAPAIVQAPGANAVLVANPSDGMIYYYQEGMAAPMGAFENYGRRADAVMVVDNSLDEKTPGVYSTTARLRRPGRYDVAFFLDTPRAMHCFPVQVEADPELDKLRRQQPPRVAALVDGNSLEATAGEWTRFAIEVIDGGEGKPIDGLEDLEILTILAPGHWHASQPTRHLGDGRYEVSFRAPQEGIYYLYASSAQAKLGVGASRPFLYVVAEPPGPTSTVSGSSR